MSLGNMLLTKRDYGYWVITFNMHPFVERNQIWDVYYFFIPWTFSYFSLMFPLKSFIQLPTSLPSRFIWVVSYPGFELRIEYMKYCSVYYRLIASLVRMKPPGFVTLDWGFPGIALFDVVHVIVDSFCLTLIVREKNISNK